MRLRSRVLRGIKWVAVGMAFQSLIKLASLAILARLLRPEDFGLMGMVTVFIGFANTFTDLGLSSAIIQRQDCSRNELSSLYWLNLVFGAAMFGLTAGLSGAIGHFYHEPELAPLVVLSAISFIISPAGMQFRALLQKDLRFDSITGIESASAISGALSSVLLAVKGYGVYSLVYGQLIQSAAAALMLVFSGRKWLPSLHFARADLKGYLSFGTYTALDQALNYTAQNVDYLIIGKYFGSTTLGYYTLAYQLISVPQQRIGPVVSRVAFPALSKLKDDKPRQAKGYLESVFLLSLISWPVCAWFAAAAGPIVSVFYGPSWQQSIILVQILAVIGLIKSLGPAFGAMLLARGRADLSFALNALIFATNTLTCLIAARWGIIALTTALAAAYTTRYVLTYIVFLERLIGIKGRDYFRQISPALEGSAVMACGIILLQSFVMRPLSLLQHSHLMLTWMTCIGVLLYVTYVYIRHPGLPGRIRKIIKGGSD